MREFNEKFYKKFGAVNKPNSFELEPSETYKEWGYRIFREIKSTIRELTLDLEKEIEVVSEKIMKGFVPQIEEILNRERTRFEEDLKNREFKIVRYELGLEAIKKCQIQINSHIIHTDNQG